MRPLTMKRNKSDYYFIAQLIYCDISAYSFNGFGQFHFDILYFRSNHNNN